MRNCTRHRRIGVLLLPRLELYFAINKRFINGCLTVILMTCACAALGGAVRINQEGRILGPLPVVTNAILFDTSNADTVVSAMQIFPVTNPWNEDVSTLPLITNSDAMIAQIITNLAASRRQLQVFQEMNFVLVPDNQPLVPIQFELYADQSDLNGGTSPFGLYPIPTNLPLEGWPTQAGGQTLLQWQSGQPNADDHAIMVQPGAAFTYETWETALVGTNWQAGNGAIFNLDTNGLRPAGWTSGDAAGLCMFSALVRYDECERGMVEHAVRMVVKSSRYNTYIYPATHYAAPATNTNVNLPAMGQRLRLKAAFVIPTNWTREETALLLGLKKYGGLVADNGNFFSISITPDDRWPADAFNDITSIAITNFEVVQSTGPEGGPRSPGAPSASAGPDQTVSIYQSTQLQGWVTFSNTPPAIQWKLYSGPGSVTFGNAGQTNTTARFSVPGVYTLELNAADGVHAVAYAAVTITVANGVSLAFSQAGTNIVLSWVGGTPPFVVQQSATLTTGSWSTAITTSAQTASLAITNVTAYFRVLSQ
jgi:hypothetical protein